MRIQNPKIKNDIEQTIGDILKSKKNPFNQQNYYETETDINEESKEIQHPAQHP